MIKAELALYVNSAWVVMISSWCSFQFHMNKPFGPWEALWEYVCLCWELQFLLFLMIPGMFREGWERAVYAALFCAASESSAHAGLCLHVILRGELCLKTVNGFQERLHLPASHKPVKAGSKCKVLFIWGRLSYWIVSLFCYDYWITELLQKDFWLNELTRCLIGINHFDFWGFFDFSPLLADNFNFHQTLWHPFIPNTLPSPYHYRYQHDFFPLRPNVFLKWSLIF